MEDDPRYHRPADVDLLIGDYSKARRELGWEPKTRFGQLARLMVDADVELLRRLRHGEIRLKGEQLEPQHLSEMGTENRDVVKCL